jgi:hypothetical protein
MDDTKRCTAKAKRTGQRCERAAVPGTHTCRVHGGAAIQVVAAGQRRLAEQKAARLAEKLGAADGMFSTDPAEVLSQVLLVAQAFLVAAVETGCDLKTRLAALDRVTAIASAMVRSQIDQHVEHNRAEAEQMAQQAVGRLQGAVVAAARRSIWAAANGDRQAAKAAMAELETDLARLSGESA